MINPVETDEHMGEGEEWVLIGLPWSGAAPQKANLENSEILFITLTPSRQIPMKERSRKLTFFFFYKKLNFIGSLFCAGLGFLIAFSQLPCELDVFQRIK